MLNCYILRLFYTKENKGEDGKHDEKYIKWRSVL